jgi:hypothetical protein
VTSLSMDPNALFLAQFGSVGVDRLTVIGTATIDGAKLEVRLADAGTIQADQFYTILSSGGLTGTFTGMPDGSRFVTSDGLGSFVINYQPTAVVLSNYQPVPEPVCGFVAAFAGTLIFCRRIRRHNPD